MLVLELEQEICRMSLEYLVVSESKDMLTTTNPKDGVMSKGLTLKEPTEKAPNGQIWNHLSNKVTLAYNPSSKINIHEFILIRIND